MPTPPLAAIAVLAAVASLVACGHVHHLPRQPRAAVSEPMVTMQVGEERRVLSDTLAARLTWQLSPSVPLAPVFFLRSSDPDILHLVGKGRHTALVRGRSPGVADVVYRDDDKITRIKVTAAPGAPAE